MVFHLRFADWIPVPVIRVFAFFANPENLPRLMPPEMQIRVDGFQLVAPPPSPDYNPVVSRQSAGVGSIIDTSFRPFRLFSWRRKWTAAITEFEWDRHFVDVQRKGPFKRWQHRHEFVAGCRDGFNGTIVRDAIEYELGFGPVGALANSLVAPRMRRVFANRQKALQTLFAEEIRAVSAAAGQQRFER